MALASAGKDIATPAGRRTPDLTTGAIGPTLIGFALPVMGSNIIQSLNGSVNTAWVSHILGEAALTATANAGQVFFLMIGVVFGISMAANIMIGQAWGARDEATARRVIGSCTVFFIVVSLALAATGVALTPAILDALATPAVARPGAIAYLRVLFTAMPFVYFFNFVMMAQRGVGDSRTPFYFALVQVALDALLNPLLIIGVGPFPRLGITGSATATLLSQSLTLTVMLAHLYRQGSVLVIRPSQWRLLIPDFKVIGALVFKGLPMGAQMIVVSLAGISMVRLVNAFGVQTAAAYGAAMQLWSYVQMPSMALSAAISAMAAQNVGAGRMDRVERISLVGAGYTFLATLAPIATVLLSQHITLLAFLPGDSPAMPIAVHLNQIAIWSFLLFGVSYAFAGVARATGAVWPPLLIIAASLWLVRVPFAYALTPRWGADAIWASYPIGSTATLLLAASYFRWGGWRKARMIGTVAPQGETPDPGQAPPSGVEESEVQAEAARRMRSSASEAPAE